MKNRMKDNKWHVYMFLAMSVLFWAVVSDAWGYSEHFLTKLPNDWNRYIYGYISRLVWGMPFLFILYKRKQEQVIPLKQLFGFHFHWNSFLLVFAISTICVLIKMFFMHGGFWINPSIIFPQELCHFFIVGFVEELVYRGYGLNALSKYMNERKANMISCLFFVALHIPAYLIHWYCDGIFSLTAMLTQVVSVFICGLLFGIVFRKSKSVWASVILHFWYDFAVVVFIG
ncbi:MAG: CPBP family intramembrane metalloprotease [Clostridium sp.]|nr:CPBP family intramembrane metalloprotease [Clostridium sp.]MCM1460685.1 CPBP family intramembrane metalloprotease [Bacteroides sp.]